MIRLEIELHRAGDGVDFQSKALPAWIEEIAGEVHVVCAYAVARAGDRINVVAETSGTDPRDTQTANWIARHIVKALQVLGYHRAQLETRFSARKGEQRHEQISSDPR